MRYDVKLLNKLLDKYERIVDARPDPERGLAIVIESTDALMKGYWTSVDSRYRNEIDAAVAELEERRWVAVRRNPDGRIKNVSLVLSATPDIYPFLNRTDPRSEEVSMFRILCSFLNHKDPTRRIAIALVNRLRDHKGIRTYVTDFEGLGEILAALDGLSELQEDTLRREFSAQVFGNPTTIDRIDARLCRLLRDFGDDDATSDDELLRRYHLVRSPSHAFIKGPIVLVVDGQTFDLGRFGHEFALNKAIVYRLAIVSLEATIIVVHDSLESFESVVGPHHLSIHLGGMHGATQRSLLRKLLETAPRLHFLYTGDIDPQGIQRFERVQAETGVKFEPFHMDITTLERNRQGWKALTPGQRTRLMELRSSDRWAATVKFMLTNDCTLEQGMIAFEPPALTRGTTL